jgi:hypothetical protein
VIVGASRNAMVFRATNATVTHNGELLDLLAPQFEEQMREFTTEDTFHRTCATCDPGQVDWTSASFDARSHFT